MDIGSEVLARFQRRRPYALPSLSKIARLLDIAFTLGHLACGEPAPPNPNPHAQALADLERAYGDAAWQRIQEQESPPARQLECEF